MLVRTFADGGSVPGLEGLLAEVTDEVCANSFLREI
mgnify:CR=1 FL=1